MRWSPPSPRCSAASPAGSSATMPSRRSPGRCSNSTASTTTSRSSAPRPAMASILLMLVTSGLAHLPPIKVVTILGRRRLVLAALVHPVGRRGARRALLPARLAAAPLWRADPRLRREAARPARRRRRRRPNSALHARQISCSDAAAATSLRTLPHDQPCRPDRAPADLDRAFPRARHGGDGRRRARLPAHRRLHPLQALLRAAHALLCRRAADGARRAVGLPALAGAS